MYSILEHWKITGGYDMLSSIFRDEIIYWNINIIENDELIQNSKDSVSGVEELKNVLNPDKSIEIFRNEENAGIIECF